MTPTRRPPKRSPFAEPVVLGLLAEAPAHGYALFARIRNDLTGVWQVGMNRLYALLDAMERAGLIKGQAEQVGHRPQRRVFHITPQGQRRFEVWLRTPSHSMQDMRIEFPPKLYFALRRSSQDVIELVRAQRDACRHELERLTARQRDAQPDDGYRALVYDFRIRQVRAILEWLDVCEAKWAAPERHISAPGETEFREKIT
ncbi:MAG: PadR family transcriptional regulator [Thermoflexales bacterium]|nr:PadR family transcriptional regulator [Thermoflexales bacterium]MDW8351322.1 PadR family transcriptional regulator [Anaerolineae bacterium]